MADPVRLRFLDVVFDAGVPVQNLTLYPNDRLDFHPDRIEVQFIEESQETVVMFLDHVRFYSVREGERVPIPVDADGNPIRKFETLAEYMTYMKELKTR